MAIPILCEILAILDFLVKGPTTRSVQDDDFEEYKEEIFTRISRRLENPLTTKEIEQHLLQALRVRRDFPDDIINLVLLQGSPTIGVDRDSKRQIEKHVKLLNLRDASKEAPRPRRARSVLSDGLKQQKRVPSVVTSKSMESSRRTAYSTRINKASAISKPRKTRKRKRRTAQHEATRSDNLVPSIENVRVLNRSQTTIPPKAIKDMPISISDESSSGRQRSVFGTSKPSDDLVHSRVPIHDTSDDSCPSAAVSESSHAVMTSELAFYKEHYEKAEEKCRILKNQRRQIENLGQIPEDTTKVLKQITRKITILKRSLEDRTTLERYFSFSNAPDAMSNSHRFIGLFQILKGNIAEVLVMEGAKEYPIENLLSISADLDGLLINVFGSHILCKSKAIPRTFPTATSFELVKALTGAAIYSWIFGAEFQSHVMGITPFLQAYRTLIATCCGYESLCNLDFAVHQSIIESESFKEVIIPTMSEMFTKRLTRALQPFFHKSLKSEATKKLQSSLGAVFKTAVEIRSESLLSASRFELIWPVAGSEASEAEMEAINSSQTGDANVVRLPLLPGLRAYSKKKTMVEYCGFAKDTSTSSSTEYVVKALVLH